MILDVIIPAFPEVAVLVKSDDHIIQSIPTFPRQRIDEISPKLRVFVRSGCFCQQFVLDRVPPDQIDDTFPVNVRHELDRIGRCRYSGLRQNVNGEKNFELLQRIIVLINIISGVGSFIGGIRIRCRTPDTRIA